MIDLNKNRADVRMAVACAADYIEKNLNRELSLDVIALHVGYSKFYLNRMFKVYMGCTMIKYLKLRRLEHAAALLANTDVPVVDIALGACYGSQQAFTLAFREVYHLAPQQYRIRQKQTGSMSVLRLFRGNSGSKQCCMAALGVRRWAA